MRSINLLPPEAARRERARRLAAVVLLGALVYLGLLALFGVWNLGKVTTAEEAVVTQQALNDDIRRQITELEPAQKLRELYQAGVKNIEVITSTDIAWGSLLTDLGRRIPENTWLTSFTAQRAFDPELSPDIYGSITVAGTAFGYPDAAAWLRAVDGEQWAAVGGAWLPGASAGSADKVTIINFSSIASLTREALSNRTDRIPVVPE